MKLTRQSMIQFGCLLLILSVFAGCGPIQLFQSSKPTPTPTEIPANASTETASAPICTATPPGSMEVKRPDKRIGGLWGFTSIEDSSGHSLQDTTSPNFIIPPSGARLVTTFQAFLQSGLRLYCDQLTLYWPGLPEPNSNFSYAVVGFSATDMNPMFVFPLDNFKDFNFYAREKTRSVPCNIWVTYSFDVGAKLANGQIIYKRAPNGPHSFKRAC